MADPTAAGDLIAFLTRFGSSTAHPAKAQSSQWLDVQVWPILAGLFDAFLRDFQQHTCIHIRWSPSSAAYQHSEPHNRITMNSTGRINYVQYCSWCTLYYVPRFTWLTYGHNKTKIWTGNNGQFSLKCCLIVENSWDGLFLYISMAYWCFTHSTPFQFYPVAVLGHGQRPLVPKWVGFNYVIAGESEWSVR